MWEEAIAVFLKVNNREENGTKKE